MLSPLRRALVRQVRATFNDKAKIRRFQTELRADGRTRAFRDLILGTPARSVAGAPVQRLLMQASVDLMPAFAREMHGLRRPVASPVVRSATYGFAETLRWAFAGERYSKAG
jgi:hypothetical protein